MPLFADGNLPEQSEDRPAGRLVFQGWRMNPQLGRDFVAEGGCIVRLHTGGKLDTKSLQAKRTENSEYCRLEMITALTHTLSHSTSMQKD